MVGLDNPLHILILLVILLLVFGAKRLPEMGRGIGEGMRGFKDAISGETQPHAAQPHAEPVRLSAAPEPIAPAVPLAQPVAAAVPVAHAEREPATPVS